MSYAHENPGPPKGGLVVLLLLGAGAVAYYTHAQRKAQEEARRQAFLALAEEIEVEDGFNPLTALVKVGGLMGQLKIVSLKRLLKSGSVEDDLGETHKYKARQAWLVNAEIHGDPVLLLVRKSGAVELLEG
jgi:hypothetical protein